MPEGQAPRRLLLIASVCFTAPLRLFDALPERGRRFVEFARAGHNDLPYHDSAAYVAAVGGFLGELE